MSVDVKSMNQEEYMKTMVHPMLNQALETVNYSIIKLIKHIIETDEIIQH